MLELGQFRLRHIHPTGECVRAGGGAWTPVATPQVQSTGGVPSHESLSVPWCHSVHPCRGASYSPSTHPHKPT